MAEQTLTRKTERDIFVLVRLGRKKNAQVGQSGMSHNYLIKNAAFIPLTNAPAAIDVASAIAAIMAMTHAVCPLPKPEALAANCGTVTHNLISHTVAARVAVPITSVRITVGTSEKRSSFSLNSLRRTASEREVMIARIKKATRVITARSTAKPSTSAKSGWPSKPQPLLEEQDGPKRISVAKI